MALEGKARLIRSESSRTVIRLSQQVVKDSQFPFQSGDSLVVRIDPDGQRLVIEKEKERRPGVAKKKAK